MTAETEKKILEIIAQADVVADPLESLVERAKTDPGAPFEPEMVVYLFDLRRDDPASYHRLRDKLRKLGVSVRELDRVIADRSGSVAAGGSQAEMLIALRGRGRPIPHVRRHAIRRRPNQRAAQNFRDLGGGRFW